MSVVVGKDGYVFIGPNGNGHSVDMENEWEWIEVWKHLEGLYGEGNNKLKHNFYFPGDVNELMYTIEKMDENFFVHDHDDVNGRSIVNLQENGVKDEAEPNNPNIWLTLKAKDDPNGAAYFTSDDDDD